MVGAGNIAQVAVLPAFAHAEENSELVAVISGDAEKRAELAEKYELELTGGYEDLERILADGRIDALYVATPNTLHKDLVQRAASRRVHVLCEKPMATSVADCERRKISQPASASVNCAVSNTHVATPSIASVAKMTAMAVKREKRAGAWTGWVTREIWGRFRTWGQVQSRTMCAWTVKREERPLALRAEKAGDTLAKPWYVSSTFSFPSCLGR